MAFIWTRIRNATLQTCKEKYYLYLMFIYCNKYLSIPVSPQFLALLRYTEKKVIQIYLQPLIYMLVFII